MRWGLVGAGVGVAIVGAVGAGVVIVQNQAPATPEQMARDLGRLTQGSTTTLLAAQLFGSSVTTGGFSFSESGEATQSETTEIPAEGDRPAGTQSTTSRTKISVSGPVGTLEREVRMSIVRGGERINLRVLANGTVSLCPDVNGQVSGDLALQISGDVSDSTSVGTGGVSRNISGKAKLTGQVNDDAVLTEMRLQTTGQQSERGGYNLEAAGQKAAIRGASSGSFTSQSNVAASITTFESGNEFIGSDVQRRNVDLQGEDRSDLARMIARAFTLNMESLAEAAMQGAQSRWRGGYCTRIIIKPPNKGGGENNPVSPGEVRPIDISVRHLFENTDISTKITATLEGKENVAPGSLDKTPGIVAYTASQDPGIYGTVALTSLSRRGRAQESVAFSTGCYRVQLSTGPYFVIDEKVCDIENPFSLRPKGEFAGVLVTFTPNGREGGSFSQSGKAYGVQWDGGGPYTISWEGGVGRFRGADRYTVTAPMAKNNENDVMTGTFTPEKR
jgi:hypothetical protein